MLIKHIFLVSMDYSRERSLSPVISYDEYGLNEKDDKNTDIEKVYIKIR